MKPVNDTVHNVTPRVVAVVVLYRVTADESVTLRSLHSAFAAHPEIAEAIDVVIWDNTPGDRQPPAGFEDRFWHDPFNPGLAAAYNRALEYATRRGAQWLVTLDQDTHITSEYLDELLNVTHETKASAILPRLTWQGRVLSPFRPRMQGPALPLEDSLIGETTEYLQAFNSGAALSVSFLSRVRGFDYNFPLDYLDHATFAQLHHDDSGMYLLRAQLEHELSSQTPGPLTAAALRRECSVLAAEHRFVRLYGMPQERRMYPVRMLRRAASVLVHRRDSAQALLIMRTLLGGNR